MNTPSEGENMGLNKIIKPGERVFVLGTYRTWRGVLTRRGYVGFTGTFTVILDGEDEESLVYGEIHRGGTNEKENAS